MLIAPSRLQTTEKVDCRHLWCKIFETGWIWLVPQIVITTLAVLTNAMAMPCPAASPHLQASFHVVSESAQMKILLRDQLSETGSIDCATDCS